jgi:hypothetical protein
MPTTKVPARKKLERSSLHQTQLELMGQDYDPEVIKLRVKGLVGIDLQEAITDAEVERTIDGASTLTIHVVDHDRLLLRSGRLSKRADVEVDGLWFRLVSVLKSGDSVDLVFEDREIAILRTYDKLIKASQKTGRFNMTRARFILRLIHEVKEFKIPWVIPELDSIQPIEADQQADQGQSAKINEPNRGHGIPHGAGHKRVYRPSGGAGEPHAQKVIIGLTVFGAPMTNAQIDVANKILDVGVSMKVRRPLLVMAMMCGIQESSMSNPRQPAPGTREYEISGTSAGWRQEIAGQGQSEAERRDIAAASRRFFTGLIAVNHQHPDWSYTQQIQAVQRSAFPNAYARWRDEAEKIVTVYGFDASAANNAQDEPDQAPRVDYQFYRGKPKTISGHTTWTKENSWACIQRLAEEVNWRAFFISGKFYYMSEDQLFRAKPLAIIDEDSKGIESIDGEYDEGKNTSELTVSAHMGRWKCPPGSTIQIINTGPFNGKWLVSSVRRSLFNDLGEITLKKPRPRLPEPVGDTTAPSDFSPLTGNPSRPNAPLHPEALDIGDAGSYRTKIVNAARTALRKGLHYDDASGPRWEGITDRRRPPKSPSTADCSGFAEWCYWAAGVPNAKSPSGTNYSSGYTGTQVRRGRGVTLHEAKPGDLVFYGNPYVAGASGHVAVYIGGGKCISVGGDPDPTLVDAAYRTPVAIRNYLD